MPRGDSIVHINIPINYLSGGPYNVNFDEEFNYGTVTFNNNMSYIRLNGKVKGNLITTYYNIYTAKQSGSKCQLMNEYIDGNIDMECEVNGQKLI